MPAPRHDNPVVLFDGVCNFCNASVARMIRRDAEGRLRFASLQSEAAKQLLAASGVPDTYFDSVVLIDDEGVHTHSDAAIRIGRYMGFPWSMGGAARVLPKAWRDRVYTWIGARRYRWFGKRETCMIPTPEQASRFLDASEHHAAAPAADEASPRHGSPA
ncbi:MAG: thiol-disulfide oxidoreductase DCC family protein [Phycisphaerales bacterium]|nr:MAG: thiol-disulfide oxidoreductase DCC family protein [Phycisphaerales bacterium]